MHRSATKASISRCIGLLVLKIKERRRWGHLLRHWTHWLLVKLYGVKDLQNQVLFFVLLRVERLTVPSIDLRRVITLNYARAKVGRLRCLLVVVILLSKWLVRHRMMHEVWVICVSLRIVLEYLLWRSQVIGIIAHWLINLSRILEVHWRLLLIVRHLIAPVLAI
jgi:hypothetical protein